jgi:hypothetical protein
MVTKKKVQYPQVIKGSHLTVTIHENGKRDLVWDDEALRRDVQAAILKVESNIPAVETKSTSVKKYTKKSLEGFTKAQLEELALTEFGVDLDRRKKKEDLITEVIKLSKKK